MCISIEIISFDFGLWNKKIASVLGPHQYTHIRNAPNAYLSPVFLMVQFNVVADSIVSNRFLFYTYKNLFSHYELESTHSK